MEQATISVKLTFWERYRISALLWFRAFRWFLLLAVPFTLIFLALVAYVVFFPSPDHTFRQLMESSGSGPYVLLGFVAIFVCAPLLFTAISYSNSRTREASRYTLSEEGIAIEHPVGNANLKWEAFVRAIETKKFFLVFVSNGISHTLPKRSFADEQAITFVRGLLRRNIKKAKLRD